MPGARPCRQNFGTIRSSRGVKRTRRIAVHPIAADPVTLRMAHAAAATTTGSADAMLLLVALLLSGADAPVAPLAHVRAVAPEVRALIADTMERSPIVRGLVARLACSDIIVYVELTASPQIPTARTKLVAAPAGYRFLRIALNANAAFGHFGPLLAHELQHALEIAGHEEVRDEDGIRRLYREIGHSSGEDAFETEAAREVEALVRRELRRKIGG